MEELEAKDAREAEVAALAERAGRQRDAGEFAAAEITFRSALALDPGNARLEALRVHNCECRAERREYERRNIESLSAAEPFLSALHAERQTDVAVESRLSDLESTSFVLEPDSGVLGSWRHPRWAAVPTDGVASAEAAEPDVFERLEAELAEEKAAVEKAGQLYNPTSHWVQHRSEHGGRIIYQMRPEEHQRRSGITDRVTFTAPRDGIKCVVRCDEEEFELLVARTPRSSLV